MFNSLKRQHKERVRSLMSFTGVRCACAHTQPPFFCNTGSRFFSPLYSAWHSEQKAIELLTECGWQLDAAADRFFMSGGGGSRSTIDQSKVEAMFNSYKGALRRGRAFKTIQLLGASF